jgi:hypothetical protein
MHAAHGAGDIDELLAARARRERRTEHTAGPYLVPADLDARVFRHSGDDRV